MLGEECKHGAGVVLRGLTWWQLGVVAIADDHGQRVARVRRRRQSPVELANLGVGLERLASRHAPPWELPRGGCAKFDVARPLDAFHVVEFEMAREGHAGAAPRDAKLGLELVEIWLGKPGRRRQAGLFTLSDRNAGPVSAAKQCDEILWQTVNVEPRSWRGWRNLLYGRRCLGVGRCIICEDCFASRRRGIGLRRGGRLNFGGERGGRFRPLAERGKFLLHSIG